MPVRSSHSQRYGKGHGHLLAVVLVVFSFLATGIQPARADEKALMYLWKKQVEAPGNHADILDLCRRYEKSFPGDSFLPVVRGLAAWHELALDQRRAAWTNLTAMLAPQAADPLPAAAHQMALRWLTRLDREQVRTGLSQIYSQRVAFPDSLNDLAGLNPAPPLRDRWDQPWVYHLSQYKRLQGMNKQRYVLESRTLGAQSDLERVLKEPYTGRFFLKPEKLITTSGTRRTLMFTLTDGKPDRPVIPEGSDFEYLFRKNTFVYLGYSLVLLSDGDHWMIYPWPPVRGDTP